MVSSRQPGKGEAMKRSYLCIGGPCAGKKYDAVLYGNHFKVTVLPTTIPSTVFDTTDTPTEIKFVTYEIETFHTPECAVQFWVPEGQKPFETMKLLLESYEKTAVVEAEIERLRKIIALYETERLNNFSGIGSP